MNIHIDKYPSVVPEIISKNDGKYYDKEWNRPLINKWTWLGSFITGFGPLHYKIEKNTELLKWANSFEDQYYNKMFGENMTYMHDLGFLYMPYSVELYRLTGAKSHKEAALKAADELCKRFDLKGSYIEAWSELDGSEENERWMIADSTMNLPLLFWAWQETGKFYYKDIAQSHINTLEKYIIREDWSVAHAFQFNEDGSPKREQNSCGFKEGSHWARGTGWIVYGLAIASAYTGNKHYLELSKNILKKWIEENTRDDLIPTWDFRLPAETPAIGCGKSWNWDAKDKVNLNLNVDSSASAIMCCAIQLINDLEPNKELMNYSDKMLQSLCDNYLNTDETVPGILKLQNGEDTYATYGDWYFVEALAKRVYGTPVCWYQEKK